MKEKDLFTENLKSRTRKLVVDVIEFYNSLNTCKLSLVIVNLILISKYEELFIRRQRIFPRNWEN